MSVRSTRNKKNLFGNLYKCILLDDEANGVDISSDQHLLAVVCGRGCYIYELATSTLLMKMNLKHVVPHKCNILMCRFAPNNTHLITIGEDMQIVTWNLTGKRPKVHKRMKGHQDLIFDASFIHNALVTCSADGKVFTWDWMNGKQLKANCREASCIRGLAVYNPPAPLQARIISACADGSISFFDSPSLDTTWTKIGGIPPDQKWAASGRFGASHAGWIDPQLNHTGPLFQCRLSSNGRFLATAGEDSTVKLWSVLSLRNDAASSRSYNEHHRPDKASALVAFHAAGRSHITGEEAPIGSGFCGRLMFTFRHDAGCRLVAFTPCSRFLATSALDATTKLWDTDTGELLFQLNLPLPAVDMRIFPSSAEAPAQDIGSMVLAVESRLLLFQLVLETPMLTRTRQQRMRAAFKVSKRKKTQGSGQIAATGGSDEVQFWPPALAAGNKAVYMPGVKRERARVAQSGLTQLDLRKTLAQGGLGSQFLQDLLQRVAGSREGELYRNLRKFDLTPAALLRLVSLHSMFEPTEVIRCLAGPGGDGLILQLVNGVQIDEQLLEYGLRPQAGAQVYTKGADTGEDSLTRFASTRKKKQSFHCLALSSDEVDNGFFYSLTDDNDPQDTPSPKKQLKRDTSFQGGLLQPDPLPMPPQRTRVLPRQHANQLRLSQSLDPRHRSQRHGTLYTDQRTVVKSSIPAHAETRDPLSFQQRPQSTQGQTSPRSPRKPGLLRAIDGPPPMLLSPTSPRAPIRLWGDQKSHYSPEQQKTQQPSHSNEGPVLPVKDDRDTSSFGTHRPSSRAPAKYIDEHSIKTQGSGWAFGDDLDTLSKHAYPRIGSPASPKRQQARGHGHGQARGRGRGRASHMSPRARIGGGREAAGRARGFNWDIEHSVRGDSRQGRLWGYLGGS